MLRFQAAKSPGRWIGCCEVLGALVPAASASDVLMKVNVPVRVFFLSRRKTLAMIAGNHRGSGIYTWIRGLKGEDMRAITSAGLSFWSHIHHQGSGRDHTGLVRVISLTNKDVRGQIVAPSSIQSTTQKMRKNKVQRIKLPELGNKWKKKKEKCIGRSYSSQATAKIAEKVWWTVQSFGFRTIFIWNLKWIEILDNWYHIYLLESPWKVLWNLSNTLPRRTDRGENPASGRR